ncbi:hypothetical protein ACFOGG_07325 [Brenneria rubrifaciens]
MSVGIKTTGNIQYQTQRLLYQASILAGRLNTKRAQMSWRTPARLRIER